MVSASLCLKELKSAKKQFFRYFCLLKIINHSIKIIDHFMILVLFIFLATVNAVQEIVELDYGSFRGKARQGIIHFLGIPFASPPIDDLRFRPPRPPIQLNNTINAYNHGPACIQKPSIVATGFMPKLSEDCLNINVWTPQNANSSQLLPVMIWVYGGALKTGGTSSYFYNGHSMVQSSNHSILFVSFNYRLGVFGWLASKELASQGSTNLGLQDQEAAFKWVQNYIHLFGGDPSRVTVAGESAGAMCIGVHLLKTKQDLFQQVILESGATMQVFPTLQDAQPVYDKLLADTGCDNSSTGNSLECLQSIPAQSLHNLTLDSFISIIYDKAFIPYQPSLAFSKGRFKNIPILLGTNTDEGTYFTVKRIKSASDLPSYYDETIPYADSKSRQYINAFYASHLYQEPYLAAAEEVGDRIFHCPARRVARIFSRQGAIVYKYRWNHQFQLSKYLLDSHLLAKTSMGVFHFSEIPFVFNKKWFFLTHQEVLLGELVNSMWIQFIKTGNPNVQDSVVDWPLYKKETEYQQLVLQTPIETIHTEVDSEKEVKCQFWDKLGSNQVDKPSISNILYKRRVINKGF